VSAAVLQVWQEKQDLGSLAGSDGKVNVCRDWGRTVIRMVWKPTFWIGTKQGAELRGQC